ncbi:MAG: alginate export family protein [Leptospirales bacterium]|nr:alginate export family protein [Leptospirales bacterium]
MSTFKKLVLLLALLLAALNSLAAEGETTPADPGEMERMRALLKAWEAIRVDGMVRVRPEWKYNFNFDRSDLSCSGTLCRARDDNQEFTGMRSELGVAAKLGESSAARIRLQDSRVWGAERGSDTGLATANDDTRQSVDVREAWLETTGLWGGLDVRGGRLILAFGDQRLIGPLDWTNVGRSFDGIRANLHGDAWSSQWFVAQLAEQDSDSAGNSTAVGAQNGDLDDARLFGIYNTFKPIEWLQIEPYYIGARFSPVQRSAPVADATAIQSRGGVAIINTEDRSREAEQLHTLGARFTNRTVDGGKSAAGPLDWTLEYAWQTGRSGRYVGAAWDQAQLIAPLPTDLFTSAANPCRVYATVTQPDGSSLSGCRVYVERQRIDAFAAAASIGYRVLESLRLGGEALVGSGDGNRNDATVATFNNLFPTNHGKFGEADLVSWQNMKAWSINLEWRLGDAGKLRIAYWSADKYRAQDAWYKVTGGGQSGATQASTESASNARFASAYNTDLSAAALGVGHLRKHLFREYDLVYEVKALAIEWRAGYSYILGGDAVGALKDDLLIRQELYSRRVVSDLSDGRIDRPAEFLALQQPQSRRTAHFAYLMATARF